MADSLRGRFPLPDLLAEVGLARRGPEPAARRRGARPARLLGGCARRAARDRHHRVPPRGGRAQGPPVGDGPPLRRARGGLEVRGLPSAALATGTLEDAVVARALRAGGRHPLDVQEGPLAQQRRHGGLLRKAQGGDVRGRDWSGWTPDAFAGELAAYICWCNASRIRALREGGRTVWDTTDGRRRRLGTAA